MHLTVKERDDIEAREAPKENHLISTCISGTEFQGLQKGLDRAKVMQVNLNGHELAEISCMKCQAVHRLGNDDQVIRLKEVRSLKEMVGCHVSMRKRVSMACFASAWMRYPKMESVIFKQPGPQKKRCP